MKEVQQHLLNEKKTHTHRLESYTKVIEELKEELSNTTEAALATEKYLKGIDQVLKLITQEEWNFSKITPVNTSSGKICY